MTSIPLIEADGSLDEKRVVQLHIQGIWAIADELHHIRKELEDD